MEMLGQSTSGAMYGSGRARVRVQKNREYSVQQSTSVRVRAAGSRGVVSLLKASAGYQTAAAMMVAIAG